MNHTSPTLPRFIPTPAVCTVRSPMAIDAAASSSRRPLGPQSPWKRLTATALTAATLCAGASNASASTVYQTRTVYETRVVLPPTSLVSANSTQYYDASMRGFREYLQTLRLDDPRAYRILKAEEQKQRQRGIGFLAAGSVVGAVGLTATLVGGLGAGDPSPRGYHAVLYGGIAVTTVGLALLSVYVGMASGGLRRLINRHNQLRPDAPLRIQPGLAASRHGVGLSARVSF